MTRRRHLPADRADLEAYVQEQVASCGQGDRADVERFLRANPGHTLRQWKGKGDAAPAPSQTGEKPWQKLNSAEVRVLAAQTVARCLPRNIRQAAANDPALIFNPLARRYRLQTADELQDGQVERPS